MTCLMLLSATWPKSTDALDAALCSLGVFSVLRRGRTPNSRKRRSTVLSWFRTLACRIIPVGRYSLSGNERGASQADLAPSESTPPGCKLLERLKRQHSGTFSRWIVLAVLARIKGRTVERHRSISMT